MTGISRNDISVMSKLARLCMNCHLTTIKDLAAQNTWPLACRASTTHHASCSTATPDKQRNVKPHYQLQTLLELHRAVMVSQVWLHGATQRSTLYTTAARNVSIHATLQGLWQLAQWMFTSHSALGVQTTSYSSGCRNGMWIAGFDTVLKSICASGP